MALDADRPLYGRGPSPGLRFTLYAILSIVLMYYDRHGQLVRRIHQGLDAAVYPMQVAVGSPRNGWDWLMESFRTRAALRAENARLSGELLTLELKTMRQQALEQENAQLRDLRAALPPLVSHWQLAEIIDVETDPLRQRVVIDKGARDGVVVNQSVVDAHGILGQVERVAPFSAEVLMVTDPEAAIPVQVARDGLRTVATGGGSDGSLLLPYLGSNADIRAGDLLVSSGLGGVFPAGFPVGRVLGARREGAGGAASSGAGTAAGTAALVRVQPLAELSRDREVVLLQFSADHPAAPAPRAAVTQALAPAHPPAAHPKPRTHAPADD